MARTENKELSVIYIEFTDGRPPIRVTVPSDTRITFAAMNPGAKPGYGNDGPVLRFYEGPGQANQRACFRNVSSFYDMSYDLEVLVEEVERDGKEVRVGGKVVKSNNKVSADRRYEKLHM